MINFFKLYEIKEENMKKKMKRTAIIMAGGSGERFWPLSRKNKPKQLLALETDKTMLEQSIERIMPIIPPEDIYIITGAHLLQEIRNILTQLPPENIIGEPFKRNTAPCLALGAAFIGAKYAGQYKPEEITIGVFTADQSIKPDKGFRQTVEATFDYVEQNEVIATIGIVPMRPETGYGYIEINHPFSQDKTKAEILPVVRFHEKPDRQKAQEYLEAKNYLWNSGMFFWRLDVFVNQMSKYLPEVGEHIEEMKSLSLSKTDIAYNTAFNAVSDIFGKFPDISIDYGLMEKADKVVVAKALFDWDDIGSWDAFDRFIKKNDDGNIIIGPTALQDVKNSTIINKSTAGKIIVSTIGLQDFVIVVTDDAVLVTPKDKVQDVKKTVAQIREKGEDKWL